MGKVMIPLILDIAASDSNNIGTYLMIMGFSDFLSSKELNRSNLFKKLNISR